MAASAEQVQVGARAVYEMKAAAKDDPTLPAPTAGAMVARVCELPIGGDLATLDVTLRLLEARKPSELTTSERRVTAMLLKDLVSQARALLTAIA